MWKRIIALGLMLAGLAGCNGEAIHDAKREQDRAEIELSQSEKQHDEDAQEITRLKSELQASTADTQQAKTDLDDANAKLKKANDDLADARGSQATTQQSADQLKAAQSELRAAQVKNDSASQQVQQLTESMASEKVSVNDLKQKLEIYAAENDRLKKIADLQHGSASVMPATMPATAPTP